MAYMMKTRFRHSPLDHGSTSIRAVRILPTLCLKGLLQCQLRHTPIDAKYICISYRRAEAKSLHDILIKGQSFRIRRNIFDLL